MWHVLTVVPVKKGGKFKVNKLVDILLFDRLGGWLDVISWEMS